MRRILLIWACLVSTVLSYATTYPEYLYEEWRKSPFPAKDIVVTNNPTALLWPSTKYWDKKDVTYNVYLSQDETFEDSKTIKSLNQGYCFFNPHQKLVDGKWYWKYEVVENGRVLSETTSTFIVASSTPGLVTPSFESFAQNIDEKHPRVLNYGRDLSDIRRDAPKHPLYKRVISNAKKSLKKEIYQGEVGSKNPAEDRRLRGVASRELGYYNALLEGYILSADQAMLDKLLERTEILLTWPTDDLLGSNVLTSLAMAYDMLYKELSDEMKDRILLVIDAQLKRGLSHWVGRVEARHVENHFWQMELAGNLKASLATLHHLESAKTMLEYLYELFVARFPNLATQDGGWAEGEGYYSVNQSAVVDVALLLKKIGNIEIFDMQWYQELPDYFIYFTPVNSPVSGFGDMHDRVGRGNTKGLSEMLMLSAEENNQKATYKLFSILEHDAKALKTAKKENKSVNVKNSLLKVEPWYQIVNDIRLSEKDVVMPNKMAHDKVFYGVGVAAMHDDVLNPTENTTVFFRSSPFGGKGHMHANQNSFNISRHGERLFYSTGYYTSFADPHSLTSYRHTRAHNAILVNGCGQAFGHEGYGWIKRHIEAEDISYVCGDATPAYRQTVDKQFVGFLEDNKIPLNKENGFADSKVTRVERHVAYARPDIVVIYDVLEAEEPSIWSLLLHTNEVSMLDEEMGLNLTTKKSEAKASVFGSTSLKARSTDQFASPALDFKKKYKSTPLQYHTEFGNVEKTKGMRFLTIIRLSDRDQSPLDVIELENGKWQVGEIIIEAEMNAEKEPQAIIKTTQSTLMIRDTESHLINNLGETQIVKDMTPVGNYAL